MLKMSSKPFDLVTAIENISYSDKLQTVIECIECYENNLYCGTRESFVLLYHLKDELQENGIVKFYSQKERQVYITLKKPIKCLKAVPIFSHLITLCDGNLLILNMNSLETITPLSKLKGINYFCLNENSINNNPFVIELCVAKKRSIQIMHLSEDKLLSIKDINCPEMPLLVAMDTNYACVATISRYLMFNVQNGIFQDILPIDSEYPVIKNIAKEEFLLTAPSGLGLFVTIHGTSNRAPLHWGDDIIDVSFFYPYILALTNTFLTIYNIKDQQVKQIIPFTGGSCLDNFNGKLFIASSNVICSILPVPWHKQIQSLINDKQIDEALELAPFSNKSNLPKVQTEKLLLSVYQRAGFYKLAEGYLDDAQNLFMKSNLDPREVINFFPGLLPPSSSFMPQSPPLHEHSSVEDLTSSDPETYTNFLCQYLECIKESKLGSDCKMEVDTALLKLYTQLNEENLCQHVMDPDTICDMEDTIDFLQKFNHHHLLAQFLHAHKYTERALKIWADLLNKKITDIRFPGLDFLVQILANLQDHTLVWEHVDIVLDKDQVLGVKVFTKRPSSDNLSEHMRPDLIVDYLHKYPEAQIIYLRHLIEEKKLEKEKFHSHLAMLLIDQVVKEKSQQVPSEEKINNARIQLQKFLVESSLYRTHLILGKVSDNNLLLESTILYGKLEDHEKALEILVYQLENYDEAKAYCLRAADKKPREYQTKVFHILLSVYLNPSLENTLQEKLLEPALELLNNELSDFDTIKILKILPPKWNLNQIEHFIKKALRTSFHRKSMARLQRGLCRGDNVNVKFNKYNLHREVIFMTENRRCNYCSHPFSESSFIRLPNGTVVHNSCYKAMNSSKN